MVQDPRIVWLRRIHLFSSFTEEDAVAFLADGEMLHVPAGEVIFREGDPDSHLYLVYQGEVMLWTYLEGKEGELHSMGLGRCRSGDYFNVEAAVWDIPAQCFARALRPTVLFRISHEALRGWRNRYPDLDALLRLVDQARERGRTRRPYWLLPHELLTVYVRPHFMAFVYRLWISLALMGVAFALFLWWFLVREYVFVLLLALGVAGLALLWAVYQFLEWRNDASAVTPLRAVQIERVLLVYEAREEIPLHMMVSKEVATGVFDRIFGMGDVIVRTQGPSLRLRQVPHPELIDRVLEEYGSRQRALRFREERAQMEAALRERLNIPKPGEAAEIVELKEEQPPPVPTWRAVLHRWFGTRVEEGGVITYYRHWFFLLLNAAWPIVLFVLTMVLWCGHLFRFMTLFSWRSLAYLTLGLMGLGLILFLYAYWEWRNDLYQVTPTQLVDLKRVLWGPEERHTASIGEVRSIDYEQPTFLARLLNYGNVYIYTGGDQPLVFAEVAAPAQVQYDIFQRLDAWQQQKLLEQWNQERARFLEWLATYHDLAQEVFLRSPSPRSATEEATGTSPPSSSEGAGPEEAEPWLPPTPLA